MNMLSGGPHDPRWVFNELERRANRRAKARVVAAIAIGVALLAGLGWIASSIWIH